MRKQVIREDNGFRWESRQERLVRWLRECDFGIGVFVFALIAGLLAIAYAIFTIF